MCCKWLYIDILYRMQSQWMWCESVSHELFTSHIHFNNVVYKTSKYNYLQLFYMFYTIFFFGATGPHWARASPLTRFQDHTQRRTTVGRTPLDEWSARRRDLYLTTHNIHDRQTSMPRVGFETTISAGQGPQTHDLERAATGTGLYTNRWHKYSLMLIL